MKENGVLRHWRLFYTLSLCKCTIYGDETVLLDIKMMYIRKQSMISTLCDGFEDILTKSYTIGFINLLEKSNLLPISGVKVKKLMKRAETFESFSKKLPKKLL